jgi:hypothetical protein
LLKKAKISLGSHNEILKRSSPGLFSREGV